MPGHSTAAKPDLSPEETVRVRTRVRLMVEISARAGRLRGGLMQAAERLTPEEASVVADLEAHGLDVIQLRNLLQGAHVLVDESYLYERWLFPRVSHQLISRSGCGRWPSSLRSCSSRRIGLGAASPARRGVGWRASRG